MNELNLFHGPNAGYALELYERYLQDPDSVDPDTRALFARWSPTEDGAKPGANTESTLYGINFKPGANTEPTLYGLDVTRIVAAARLIRYIRELGHLDAHINPLNSEPPGDPGLRLDTHGLTEADLAALPAHIVRGPLVAGAHNALEGVNKLREVYSGSIGYETDHIQAFEERAWIREAAEDRRFFYGFDAEHKQDLLERLTEVEMFERFLHQTFVGQKRFSLEGCDLLILMLDSIIRNAATSGTHEVVIGMAHRGRLNVLAHIIGQDYKTIMSLFNASNRDDGASAGSKGTLGWTGDVKYHLGARRAYRESGVEQMPLTLAPNPSHLEYVNPVVVGRARAAQDQRNRIGQLQQDKHASLPILMHGDAAFPGQGVVAETLNLSNLKGYSVGGAIHIIINNQIGFTTEPCDSRSTLYASDLAKGFEIPIFHVNADDVEACIAVARMAHAYREKFRKDVLIDLVGYRRWGHNEGDEPAFTQPLLYDRITNHPTVREQWARKLQREGAATEAEANQITANIRERLQQALREAEGKLPEFIERTKDKPIAMPPVPNPPPVLIDHLQELNESLLARPKGFIPNQKLDRMLQRRLTTFEQGGPIDWGHAEALAFATILARGTPIRLTGQDSERGTFSQRHLVLHDIVTGEGYIPHQALPQSQASFAIYDSPLSENAVLGFEYGYSMHAPNTLVLWEAQFGDFANGAQVFIDQFIASGRAKWDQTPSLVLLLPNGYEGQGPEHSSGRLERFLQLSAADNIRVVNCTTAAQYFHLLRRHAFTLQDIPRPLIVMTPKSLLRHPLASSTLKELTNGQFFPVLPPPDSPPAQTVNRLILCSGKVYIDLISSGELNDVEGITVARIEELYPFPIQELKALLATFTNLHEIVWLQEEPRNMGGWCYMNPRLREILETAIPVYYCGRPESASPAEGSLSQHIVEQARILHEAVHGVFEDEKMLSLY